MFEVSDFRAKIKASTYGPHVASDPNVEKPCFKWSRKIEKKYFKYFSSSSFRSCRWRYVSLQLFDLMQIVKFGIDKKIWHPTVLRKDFYHSGSDSKDLERVNDWERQKDKITIRRVRDRRQIDNGTEKYRHIEWQGKIDALKCRLQKTIRESNRETKE